MTTARGKRGQGVKGRRVTWQDEEWIVGDIWTLGGVRLLELERDYKGRSWVVHGLPRSAVKFVRHDYEVKA